MAGKYYVFEMGLRSKGKPYRQINLEPLGLTQAKQLARIGATMGRHDREVTTDPRDRSPFKVEAHYEAKTGRKVSPLLFRRKK